MCTIQLRASHFRNIISRSCSVFNSTVFQLPIPAARAYTHVRAHTRTHIRARDLNEPSGGHDASLYPSGLSLSMEYLYRDSERWTSLRTLLWHNR